MTGNIGFTQLQNGDRTPSIDEDFAHPVAKAMKTSKPSLPGPAERAWRAGDMYSFQTSPATDFAPKETQRYAALKVLGLKGKCVCYVALSGVFDRHPNLAEVVNLPWLINTRFGYRDAPTPASRCVPRDWDVALTEFR